MPSLLFLIKTTLMVQLKKNTISVHTLLKEIIFGNVKPSLLLLMKATFWLISLMFLSNIKAT